MNKPAPKEPSMDEILSSIRQIIADDDAAASPRRPQFGSMGSLGQGGPPAAGLGAAPALRAVAPPPEQEAANMDEDDEMRAPLALSPEQIVPFAGHPPHAQAVPPPFPAPERAAQPLPVTEPSPMAEYAGPNLTDPEDISFDSEAEDDQGGMLAPVMPPPLRERPPLPRPATRVSEAAPLPDRNLTGDIAERLIEPATNAAVRHTFARLNSLPVGNPGITVEGMIREMLRPLLKEWLDENLPAMVERMVEKEIARISRGVE